MCCAGASPYMYSGPSGFTPCAAAPSLSPSAPSPPPAPAFLPGHCPLDLSHLSLFQQFAIVTKDDASIAAHTIYRGLHVGGDLIDAAPHLSKVVSSNEGPYHSYIGGSILPTNQASFSFNNGGVTTSATSLPVDFSKLEALALALRPSSTVHIVTQGGSYSASDSSCPAGSSYDMHTLFNNPEAQAENNGADMVVFTGKGTVCLTRTANGRAFGPSVLAPFARVIVVGQVGFVDGLIVARSLHQPDSQVQLHGDVYTGPMSC